MSTNSIPGASGCAMEQATRGRWGECPVFCASHLGTRTMTTESKNGTITLTRMNISGYVGHVTIFSWMLTTACCLVVGP